MVNGVHTLLRIVVTIILVFTARGSRGRSVDGPERSMEFETLLHHTPEADTGGKRLLPFRVAIRE